MSIITRKIRKKRIYKRSLKLKLYKTQSEQKLPEVESNSKFWADSLSDGETVIDTTNAEDSLEESSEDETSEEVKRGRVSGMHQTVTSYLQYKELKGQKKTITLQ